MGGQRTAVSKATTDVFLECAYFDPIAIAGRARGYGLHTDASHRYERGVDYQLQEQALERATQLLVAVVGGTVGPCSLTQLDEHMPAAKTVTLRGEKIKSGLGFDMSGEEVVDILTRLGLKLISGSNGVWNFEVPSYRFDISIEADLLEELARVYGYNRLPTTSIVADLTILPKNETKIGIDTVRQQLVAKGFQEAICYSFVSEALQAMFDPKVTPIALQNPISADMAVMRTSLWPGLVQVLQYNLNRQQTRAKLFETGLSFQSMEQQIPVLAGLIYGTKLPESWNGGDQKVDFYDLKGVLESVLALTDSAFGFRAASHPALHPGQTAAIIDAAGQQQGWIGALHPQLQQQLDIPQPVYLFELNQAAIAEAQLPVFETLSKFPEVRRDLAVLLSCETTAAELQSLVLSEAGEYLIDLKVFDVYTGKGIDPERKSVALGLTYQHPSRTLTEDEINSSVDAIVASLGDKLGASLR
jgi:phenylalanyl-tRNA synthetase beta chain